MYLPFKKQTLKALKCLMKDFQMCPAYKPNNYTCKPLQPGSCCSFGAAPAACALWKVRKIHFGCSPGERAAEGCQCPSRISQFPTGNVDGSQWWPCPFWFLCDSPSSEIWVKHTSLLSGTSKKKKKIISSKDKEINYGDNAD